METELKQILEQQQIKIDRMHTLIEKMHKYMLWSLIGTLVFFILPLIALMFIAPIVMKGYISNLSDLGL